MFFWNKKKALEGKSEVDDEVDLDHMTGEVSDFFPDDNVDVDIPDEMDPEGEGRLDREVASEHSDELVEEDVISLARKHRKSLFDNISSINVAPGEGGEFKNWKEDIFLEEKAFPHLFPYGTGGYLSSCLSSKTNMGFATYIRHRVRNADPKFRNDQTYLFFLLQVKELVELKNCISTYLRQARNTPATTKELITDTRIHNLERYNRSFAVFKKMRGSSSFYEAAKSNLMAMIRQRGAPSLFITLSSAEYQWESLLKKCYEAKHRTECTCLLYTSPSPRD